MGAGLLLHNLRHTSTSCEVPGKDGKEGKDLVYACTCLDDFLMPFAEADAPVYVQPVFVFVIPVTFYEQPIPFHTPVFPSLRGPPADLL